MRYNLSKKQMPSLAHINCTAQKVPKLRSSLSQSVICTLTQPYLVTEDFNLAVGTVHRFVTPVVVAVGVNLKIQGQAFNSLLRRKVCAEAVHRDENLQKRKTVLISSVTLIAHCLDWPCFRRSPSTFPGHLDRAFLQTQCSLLVHLTRSCRSCCRNAVPPTNRFLLLLLK